MGGVLPSSVPDTHWAVGHAGVLGRLGAAGRSACRARTATSRELVEGRRRLDNWRQTRRTRAMPEELWALAARLGVRHGASPTARVSQAGYQVHP